MEDAPGDGADVGAAVAADLGLVAHAAERHAGEFASQRLGDALAEGGFPHARRSDEAEDAAARRRVQRAHGEVLENPLLDRLQVVVVAIEDLARRFQVEPVLRHLPPRQPRDHVEVRTRDVVLGGLRRHLPQALELAVGDFLRFGREARRLEPLAELGELVVGRLFAELLFDHLQLLAQHVLALVLVEPRLDLFLDLVAHLEHLQLLGEELVEALEAPRDVRGGEQLRLGGQGDVEVRGDEVGELAGVVDALEDFVQLRPQVRRDSALRSSPRRPASR